MITPNRKIILCFALAFAGAGAFFWWHTVHSRQVVIKKGLQFYDTPENMATLRIDDAFLLRLIDQSRKEKEIHTFSPAQSQTFALDPLKRLMDPDYPVPELGFYRRAYPYEPLPTINNNSYLISPLYEKYLRDPYDDILFKSLYCDLGSYDVADFAILKSIKSGTGDYADTHHLWGLLMLLENGCFDREQIETEIDATSSTIIQAAEADTLFSDLYAERIVLLYWAGFGDAVKSDWIEKVKMSLTDDPGWRDAGHDTSNAHTTGLALLSLLYFEAGKKEQSFYSRTPIQETSSLEGVFSGGTIFSR